MKVRTKTWAWGAASLLPVGLALGIATAGEGQGAAAIVAALGGSPAQAQSIPTAPMVLGTQTHMSQGWPSSTIDIVRKTGAPMIRDSVPWTSNEKVRGVYDFSGSGATAISRACAAGLKVIATLPPMNPLYDGGYFTYTDTGKLAYARYIEAVLKRFGSCIAAIEVGNEINGASAPEWYAAGVDPTTNYVSLLAFVSNQVRGKYPVKILGGSTNMIGTGFLEKLFAAGMLPLVDAVAVHPYRMDAHSVDFEIANLYAVMRAYGTPVPIWATEWSHDTTDQTFAAGELLKMVALMSASGVERASWYALLDQTAFPNMGLYAAGAVPKRQALAYQFVQANLVNQGRAVRVDLGDPLLFAYRFGTSRYLIWGAPRTITISGGQAYNSIGQAIAGTTIPVGSLPVALIGGSIASVGDSNMLADSQMGYGSSQWSYWAQTGTTKPVNYPIGIVNDWYTSYYSGSRFKPMRINMDSGAAGGNAVGPIRAVMRYVSPVAQQADITACLTKKVKGDGVDYSISVNGRVLASGVTLSDTTIPAISVDLAAGDKVELVVGPNQTFGGDVFGYRMSLFRRGKSQQVVCR